MDVATAACPTDPAIICSGESVSFEQLSNRAREIADLIAAQTDSRRAIMVGSDGSVDSYAAYLACAMRPEWVPIPVSTTTPESRRLQIAQAAGAAAYVVSRQGAIELEPLCGAESSVILPENCAYILFTSGSTGQPKGVPISEVSLNNYVQTTIDRTPIDRNSRIAQTSDLSFDLSLWGMALAWGNGLPLMLPGRGELMNPIQFFNRNHATHVIAVPSLARQAEAIALRSDLKATTLKWSAFCGEALTYHDVRSWKQLAPNTVIWNYYGPTELTVSCASYEVDPSIVDDGKIVPIGTMDPGFECKIIDENGEVARYGELVVRGIGRFSGYLSPADNRGRFWDTLDADNGSDPSHPDTWYRTGDIVREERGDLAFLGRNDDQAKIGGFRVELREIEREIMRVPHVREAVVVQIGDAQNAQIAAVFLADGDTSDQIVRSALKAVLPRYALPRTLKRVESLPRMPNGKTDRRAVGTILAERY